MLHFAEFVEALSAPLQFMSQAEKRAKQMQDMGIDEKDISEVPMERKDSQKDKVTENSSASLDKQANSAVTPASAGKTAATPSNSTAAGTTAEKKSQISSKCIPVPLVLWREGESNIRSPNSKVFNDYGVIH